MNTILYVSPFAYSISGADESLFLVLRYIDRQKFIPYVITPKKSPYSSRYRTLGISVDELSLLRLKRTFNFFYWLWFFAWLPIEVILFYVLMRKNNIDLVHVNMESIVSPLIAARLLRIPAIVHYRGNAHVDPKWFFSLFFKFLNHASDHIFAISHAVKQKFDQLGYGQKVHVLYNAVDLSCFEGALTKNYFHQKNIELTNKKIVTYLGRIHPRKRIEDMIEAANIISAQKDNIAFAIIGYNEQAPEDEAYYRELKNRVAMHSLQSVYFFNLERNVVPILQASHVFVLPSMNEGFGRTLIEAMAGSVPVIATDSGAFPEILQYSKYGSLVPVKSPQQLADAIMRCLKDPDIKDTTKKAREYVCQNFDIKKHVIVLEETYQRLIQQRSTKTTGAMNL